MKALEEIGIAKAIKYSFGKIVMVFYALLLLSPLKTAFLRILGAKIGRNSLFENVKFFNLYRKGFPGLNVGKNCFVGEETCLDLVDEIELEDHVTLGERIVVLTHTNVGYKDHPLQKTYPPFAGKTVFKKGCFIGSGAIILPGVEVGACAVVAAGSVITKNVDPYSMVAGNPAKEVKKLAT